MVVPSGALAMEKLFDQYPTMDSIFVANDQMALGAMQFFAEKKLRIPEDVGIVGFDDISRIRIFLSSSNHCATRSVSCRKDSNH